MCILVLTEKLYTSFIETDSPTPSCGKYLVLSKMLLFVIINSWYHFANEDRDLDSPKRF